MKTKILFSTLVLIFGTLTAFSQRGPYYSDRYNTTYRYNQGHNARLVNANPNYNRYLNRMDRYERKLLRKLLRTLEQRERWAWEDGRISRREARRIQEVQYDIEDLIAPYRNRRNGRNTIGTYRGCR